MLVSPSSAEALASIILRSTQGEERVQLQLPWIVEDRDDCWLVRGTPFDDRRWKLKHCQFSIFICKASAEVVGIRSEARCDTDDDQYASLKTQLPEEALRAMSGPVLHFEPDRVQLDLCSALYGGLINTPNDAIDFAYAVARDDAGAAPFVRSSYEAVGMSEAWRITCCNERDSNPLHLCSLSRRTGKVTSGLLAH